eukprot:2618814-Pyramimonas_sp.AAC.1
MFPVCATPVGQPRGPRPSAPGEQPVLVGAATILGLQRSNIGGGRGRVASAAMPCASQAYICPLSGCFCTSPSR